MRRARKKAQDAKHVPPPDPRKLPAPGVSMEEATAAEREAEGWNDISRFYRQIDAEERRHLEWWERNRSN
jgi:hypothetical protein